MEGAYRMNKLIIFFCVIFPAVLMVSCGRNEKAALMKKIGEFHTRIGKAQLSGEPDVILKDGNSLLALLPEMNDKSLMRRLTADTYESMAKAFLLKQQKENALRSYEMAYEVLSKNTLPELEKKCDLALFLTNYYRIQKKEQEFQSYIQIATENVEHLEKLASKQAANGKTLPSKFRVSLNLESAEFQMDRGQYQSAVKILLAIAERQDLPALLQSEPVLFLMLFGDLGMAYSLEGNDSMAVFYLRKCFELCKQQGVFPEKYYLPYVNLLMKTGKYQEAISFCEEWRDNLLFSKMENIESKRRTVQLKMAEIYNAWGKNSEAKKYAEQVLNTNPSPAQRNQAEAFIK